MNYPFAPALRFVVRPLALAGLLLGLAARPAQAQQTTPVTVTSADATSIRLRIDNAAHRPGRVQVLSRRSGQVLFDETFAAPAYGHRFNFRDLAAGRYVLLVQTGGRHYRYTFQTEQNPAGAGITLRMLRTQGPELLAAAR
ncbi:hypothetical protein SAMN02745146_0739 [Hymenobacter daecheongensis DSM 21074]|uniref:Por secretion system C-terminal sorting domain-containing protein n=1 Tax=Hymenobacter daecheongensis DSM 21074 TaxID=1121955 RepID=A0A1M6ARL3_9BACT|nr:hypothetical protein [Hymenobacter daecheongensis]SHI39112.1 hypothetical protein SAMN02745146_0739 [Hymenobacter daecheongensis DSM 21074]